MLNKDKPYHLSPKLHNIVCTKGLAERYTVLEKLIQNN